MMCGSTVFHFAVYKVYVHLSILLIVSLLSLCSNICCKAHITANSACMHISHFGKAKCEMDMVNQREEINKSSGYLHELGTNPFLSYETVLESGRKIVISLCELVTL